MYVQQRNEKNNVLDQELNLGPSASFKQTLNQLSFRGQPGFPFLKVHVLTMHYAAQYLLL